MVQIGICDDDKDMVFRQEDMVKKTLTDMGVGCRIITYTKSSNLLWKKQVSFPAFFTVVVLRSREFDSLTSTKYSQSLGWLNFFVKF